MKQIYIIIIGLLAFPAFGQTYFLPSKEYQSFPQLWQELIASNFLQTPLKVNEDESAMTRWLKKPVLKSIPLDNMESLQNWNHIGYGSLALSSEIKYEGISSLQLSSPTKGTEKNSNKGRPFGEASALRKFNTENWNDYNRLSFYVFPISPGAKNISMRLLLENNGKGPKMGYYQEGLMNFTLLKPNQWNQIVWEIPYLERDSITGVRFTYLLQGNERGAADSATLYLDKFELQKVKEDHFKGWNTPNGEIAYSYTGYNTGLSKTAITSDLSINRFKIINAETGKLVLSKSTKQVICNVGSYQVLDFSEIREPGIYKIQAGSIITKTFRIDDNVWLGTIWKVLNFFYSERCGYAVPGVHDICHADWQGKYNDKTIIINGGWHDAGDLSQGLVNTSEAAYSMLKLADKVQTSDTVLYNRLIEEAKWGLQWMLKTRFGDGNRMTWAVMDFWTDGIIGNIDDVDSYKPSKSPYENFMAIRAEAYAAQILKKTDAAFAEYCRKAAIEDWEVGMGNSKDFNNIELASEGAFATLELYTLTKSQRYADKAIELAKIIMGSQQREGIKWNIPLAGFFYTNQKKDKYLHYEHRCHEQTPVMVMIKLCNLFPENKNWMEWYTTVLLYSEYMKKISSYSGPFSMLASGVYDAAKYKDTYVIKEIENGMALDTTNYLRLFPVSFSARGNNGTVLSQTKAVSAASVLRNELLLNDLSQRQLQWVLGNNPFKQSLMYGEGYNYSPQYTAMSGDIVGSLPVGSIQQFKQEDIPYCPASNCWAFKEVWVHPASRWLWLMDDLEGTATVTGKAKGQIVFIDKVSKSSKTVTRNNEGNFKICLSAGEYIIKTQGFEKTQTLLPGQSYNLNLIEGLRNIHISYSIEKDNRIIVTAKVTGEKISNADLRAWNLELNKPTYKSDQKNSTVQIITWEGNITSSDRSWAAVIIPDGKMQERTEFFNLTWLDNKE